MWVQVPPEAANFFLKNDCFGCVALPFCCVVALPFSASLEIVNVLVSNIATFVHTDLQFLKLEEVGDQIRLHKWHVQHRGSLMARLLHHTIDHTKEREAGETGESPEQMEEEEEKIVDTDDSTSSIVIVDV